MAAPSSQAQPFFWFSAQQTLHGPTSFVPYRSWAYWAGHHWAQPTAPFPTTSWAPPPSPSNASSFAGLLGPRPVQSYHTETSAFMGYVPTDINHAMNTGATSHMTRSQGNLPPYFPLNH